MGYCFMTIEKIKTRSELAGKFGHNYRMFEVKNADPALIGRNHEITSLNGLDYCQCFDKTMEENNIKHIRKNAVLALEVLTTFSKEDFEKIDIKKWEKDNKEWLEKEFNINPNKNNVKSMMFHGDENGNVHIHTFVIPIDERGNLNASRFLDGKAKMRHLQDTYGEMMKTRHNLNRGLENSAAKHQDIKRYYTALNQTLSKNLDKPLEYENAKDYYKKANKQYIDSNLKNLSEQKKLEQKIAEIRTREENKRRQLVQENKELKKILSKSEKILEIDLEDEIELERVRYESREYKKLQEGLKLLPDKNKALQFEEEIKQISKLPEKEKKKKKKIEFEKEY